MRKACDFKNKKHFGIKIYDDDAGEIVCSKCGVVLEEKTTTETLGQDATMTSSSLSSSSSDSKTNRNARASEILDGNNSIYSVGATVQIGKKDHNGNEISPEMKKTLDRLWNSGSIQKTRKSNTEKQQMNGLSKMETISSKLYLPEFVQVETAQLYKKIQRIGLVKGRITSDVVAACIYHSCKNLKMPVTMAEIADAAGIDKKRIFRILREILRVLELSPTSPSSPSMPTKDTKNKKKENSKHDHHHLYSRYTAHVPRIASKIKLSQKMTNDSISLIERQDIIDILSGKSPAVIAACAIYCIVINGAGHYKNNHDITQEKIADAAGITTMSMRNQYRKFVV